MLEADHYRDAIAASKGEKFCPACHKAVMREASFCPYCGAACPTPEPEIEGKNADVIESTDEELEKAAEAEVADTVEETEAGENASDETAVQEAETEAQAAETAQEEAAEPVSAAENK